MRNHIRLLATLCCAMTTTVAFQSSATPIVGFFPGSQCTGVSNGPITPWLNWTTEFINNTSSTVILANCPIWTDWATVHNHFRMDVSHGWANTTNCLMCTGNSGNVSCYAPNSVTNYGTFDNIIWDRSISSASVEVQCFLPQNAVIFDYYYFT